MQQLGRYQIVGELGQGAMGIVFRALDPNIGREVALKTIRLADFASAEHRSKQRDRLFREARSAGILSHPGIVTIYDVAEQDNVAYISMEYVAGRTLEQLLSANEALPEDQIFSLLRQTADALDYAHRKGIVHRDIKPANIMVTETGTVKIADFGIAKISALDQLTQSGLIVGTPNYMAPEQVQGKPVSGFADQYSLGVIAYEILTGERPFEADQLATLVFKIVCEEPVSPKVLNPSLGHRIDEALHRALAKRPDARYENCTAAIQALEAACAETPGWKSLPRGRSTNLPTVTALRTQIAVPLPVEPPPDQPSPPVALPPPHRARRESGRRSKSPIAYFMTVVLALAFVGLVYYAGKPIITPAPAPAPATDARSEAPTAGPKAPPTVFRPQEAQAPTPAPPKPAEESKPAGEPKPEAEGKAEEAKKSEPAAETPKPEPEVAPTPPPKPRPRLSPTPGTVAVEVPVRTDPPGARVMLDGLPGTACTTPCSLSAAAGRHRIHISRAGFKDMVREVEISREFSGLPTINLAVARGTIMLSSDPAGATIFVNEAKWSQPTP
ncbi:MAG: serine/threonine-protein kinase, partial [Bryobacteraceae bacterium]